MVNPSRLPPDPTWYKDAVIYQAHVRAFFDSTNDGIGDFRGLTSKLPYLEALGVNALWLLPFYPSPLRDDGYDISDYENINPSYGTLEDFEQFIDEAHRRGLRVITELVINHTSDQHPWFQAARRAPAGAPEREFYVWSETNQKYPGVRIIFKDTETSNWKWDDLAGAYYWHRFFHHQPDLNFDNPEVLGAVVRVMRFWLDRGVDGLRLDAVPYLIERDSTTCENLEETHAVLRRIRHEMNTHYPDRMLIAEANQWPADVRPYFGDDDECHMAFHFPLMPRMYMAVRQEDRHPIVEILRQTPDIPEGCQWGLFLRNHDELTLEMVTDEERDYMYQAYAADPQMRINSGIRRRLAPLLENSRRGIELMNSLLFSLPGTPVIYYGDELGMGDNIYLGDRNSVRTPMQWTGDRNGGFSRADPARLYAPLVMDPLFGYQAINVEAQERSAYSLLNWMKRMIGLRKLHRVFGRGTIQFLPADSRKVIAYVRSLDGETVLCVANLSHTVQPVELDLSRFRGMVPVEMLGPIEFPRIGEAKYFLTLGAYAFYWFRLQEAAATITERVSSDAGAAVPEAPALLAGAMWESLLDGNVRTLVERDLLVPFLQRQPWFGNLRARSARFVDWGRLESTPQPRFMTIVEAELEDGEKVQYFLPLTIASPADAKGIDERSPYAVLARITGARKGLMFDGWLDDGFAHALLASIERERQLSTRRGTMRASRMPVWNAVAARASSEVAAGGAEDPAQPAPLTRATTDQLDTRLRFGNRFELKLHRQIHPGISPDVEMVRHLTEAVGFARVPAIAGTIDADRPNERATTIATLQQAVESQADGWTHATEWLSRFYDQVASTAAPEPPVVDSWTALAAAEVPLRVRDVMSGYLETAEQLGRRTAELHLALAADGASQDFAPEPIVRHDLEAVSDEALAGADRVFELLGSALSSGVPLSPPAWQDDTRAAAERLAGSRATIAAALRSVTTADAPGIKIRIHGYYRLAQVIWAEGDFYIQNFDGDPAQPHARRRDKQSPVKDIAGMLRSFGYAADAAVVTQVAARPGDAVRLHLWAHHWQIWTSAHFLRGYAGITGSGALLPASPEARESLLRFFLLAKALREMHRELANRPDWLWIPLRATLDLIDLG